MTSRDVVVPLGLALAADIILKVLILLAVFAWGYYQGQ
jgi:hypothetical protein